jgi:dienelactone hydrolase
MLRRQPSSIHESQSASTRVQLAAQRIHETHTAALRAVKARRKTLVALVLASFFVLCATAWPFARAHLQALAVLRLVAGQQVPWIAAKLVTEPITTEEIQIPGKTGAIRARLYRPVKHPNAPGLVLLHGVHHLGMNEPRLMGFASAMASCGLRVLTPELPGIRDYHIDQSSVQVIGESTRWFTQKTGGPVGVMGLSFSGGLALVSASDPVYRPDFKFVLAVGSQDNVDQVTQFYLTGTEARPDGSIERLRAHEYGALVLEYGHLENFVPAEDIEAIRPVLREHLYEDKAAENLAVQKLNERQKLETLELMDSSSATTLAKLAATEAKHVEEMEALSPHGRLRNLTTPVFLLHGQADNIIPSAETLWMASELSSTALQAVLVSPVLSHVNVSGPDPGAWDQWRLVHFFALVMDAARRK